MGTHYVPTRIGERTLCFRDWSCLRYHLILAYDGPVREQAKRSTVTNEHDACWLLRKGSVRLMSEGRTITAHKGQWVFVGRKQRRQVFSDDAQILSLHFDLAWPGGEPVVLQDTFCVIDAADCPALERAARPVVRRMEKTLPKSDVFIPAERCSLTQYLAVQDLLPAWLAAYLAVQEKIGNPPRRLEQMDERVMRVVGDLDRQRLDEAFSAERLCKSAGLGKSQLNELFSRALGRTPRRYFEERRLAEARSLLRHTRTGVKQAAFALGFRHESHFSLWFRRHEGLAPSLWRIKQGVFPA